jgi:hypothetical protein
MVPLQTLPPWVDAETAGLAVLLLVALGPGTVATVLWTPFLLSERLRAGFRALDPFGFWPATYLLVGVLGGVPQTAYAVLAVGRVADGASGAAAANALLDATVGGAFAVALVGWAVPAVVAPRLGLNWDPTEFGASTHALVAAGAVWYAAVVGAPFLLLAFVFALPS